MSVEPFNRLVKLAARAFYDDKSAKTERSDDKGFAVVVLDALTRRQWVREENLAKDLKLNLKKLRKTLHFFEEEKLITRCYRKESTEGAKLYSAAVAAAAGHQTRRDGDDKIKLHTQSYCCLDYAQIYDVVRYKLHHMKKKLKDELENKNSVQEYICPNCRKRYDAFDAPRLLSIADDSFHCESCNGEVVVDSQKLANQESGDGDDNATRQHRDKLKDLLQKLDVQLKPLTDQLSILKDLPAPEFGSLQAWEVRANDDFSAGEPFKYLLGLGFGGTTMPFVGETKVEVAFLGSAEKEENIKSDGAKSAAKPLPPWMIKQGMNLTEEQRGKVKVEAMTEGTSTAFDSSDDKEQTTEEVNMKCLQEENARAYYATLLQRQQEQAAAIHREQELSNTDMSDGVKGIYLERQVGMKSKHDDFDDVEWDDALPSGNTRESCEPEGKSFHDQAGALGDEDDAFWEEG
ncbi:uncharacterized protein LOC130788895 [Actinidia eriantha]|uniref:uncharacterized protein LOC130788895 n=1 Tax=Actinidia eriantha TaxID=165200 RepID=UPI0025834D1E|nr:uncharacterized protein LOC130788895 [Actinidia eriantha]